VERRSVRQLAAGRTVEDHPDRKVVAELFETVFGSRGDEQAIARLERIASAIVEQDASTGDDDVDLVLRMRRLPVRWKRARGKFHLESAASQDRRRALTGRTGNARLRVGDVHDAAPNVLAHVLNPFVSILHRR